MLQGKKKHIHQLLTGCGEQNYLRRVLGFGLTVLPRCSAGPGDPGVSVSFRTLHHGGLLQPQALQNLLLEPGQQHASGQLLRRAALSQALDPERAQDEDCAGRHDWDAARRKTLSLNS